MSFAFLRGLVGSSSSKSIGISGNSCGGIISLFFEVCSPPRAKETASWVCFGFFFQLARRQVCGFVYMCVCLFSG